MVVQILQSAFNVGLSVFPFPYVGKLITREPFCLLVNIVQVHDYKLAGL